MKPTSKKFLKILGTRVKELRKSQKISQEQLAYESNLHRIHLLRIENGKLNTSIGNLLAICKALNISLKELFDFEH